MTPTQKVQIRMSETRERVNDLAGAESADDISRRDKLSAELKAQETELRAAIEADDAATTPEPRDDAESRELTELRSKVGMGAYVGAAMERRGVSNGAELELNQALGIPGDYFPMSLLEDRAAISGDAQSNEQAWVDRVFAASAAARVGVSFRTVAPGVTSVPVTTAGATGAQRGTTQAATNAAYTVGVTELKPKRQAVHTIFSVEDAMRLPGLEEAITRDLRGAVVDAVDKAVFIGDATANPNAGDIVGFTTAGITEVTITQANKILTAGVISEFAGLVDGQYAAGMGDLRLVLSVGANKLWVSTIPNASSGNNESIAQIMAGNGLSWQVRGGIEENSANGDYGAFIGLARGIEGAAVAAVYDAGQLIRDPYSDADTGEVRLTLNYLWDFQVPRTDNFRRLKFVT